MALFTWWHTDPLPALAELRGFHAGQTDDIALFASLANLDTPDVQARLQEGHRPYVAWIDGYPVAYGWVATTTAMIGELALTISLATGDRYLWDFATLPAWRGRGVYSRLLQAILRHERAAARRFWILAAPENVASGCGIARAGFLPVGDLSFQVGGGVGLRPGGSAERARLAAAIFRAPLLAEGSAPALIPCWRCVLASNATCTTTVSSSCWHPQPCLSQDGSHCSCEQTDEPAYRSSPLAAGITYQKGRNSWNFNR